MSDYTRRDLLAALDLDGTYDGFTFTVGRFDDTNWKGSYDPDTGKPAVVWVEYVTLDGDRTEIEYDAERAGDELHSMSLLDGFDPEHGVTVTVSPWWLFYTGQLAA
ncbi:MAG: hypothetical protein A2Y38_25520 [Spirochaetes bacterium GWB1_59_5]|nr:MAG: hypothetical protein A2Y38_25520 [Spirochaetes bacterium GWB1_59_5]